MSKGLEALEELRMLNKFAIEHNSIFVGEALYQIIEKELKVVELLRDKGTCIDIRLLILTSDYETYCFMVNKVLTQEEYDFLKSELTSDLLKKGI